MSRRHAADVKRSVCAGFTLVEVLIAVSVTVMLAAVAYPSYERIREDSREAQAESDLAMIATATRQLAWDTGTWPGGLNRTVISDPEMWDLNSAAAGLCATDGRYKNWQGPYLEEVELDPWGSPYFFDPDFRVEGVVCSVVGSFGPNKSGRNVYDSDNIFVVMLEP